MDHAAELAKITARLEEDEARLARVMVRAEEVSAELRASDDTNHSAEFLGKVLYDQDEMFGVGTVLCLEWTLDRFMAHAFEKAYPLLIEVHEHLVKNGHGERNKREYFNDSEAFFVREDGPVCVFGRTYRDAPRYLWIDRRDEVFDSTWHRSYVRRIWQQTKLDCLGGVAEPVLRHYREVDFEMKFSDGPLRIYGDARDQGHVLTYEKTHGRARCDKVIWDVNAPLHFLFDVNTLHSQLIKG